MDLSDGLGDAVHQLAAASGVGAVVDADALPIEPAAAAWFAGRGADPVARSIAGGDDYELLMAVGRRNRKRFEAVARSSGVAVARIGVCTPERHIVLRRGALDAALPHGFDHFR